MKQTFILSIAATFVAATIFTSCHPSRVWATKKKEPKEYREQEVYRTPTAPITPVYYNRVALVISPTPGFVMRQSPDGRFYHRSQQGYLYWKGFDNRFYLDRKDIRNVTYNRWEYDEWRKGAR